MRNNDAAILKQSPQLATQILRRVLERLAGIVRETVDELVVLTKMLFPDGATEWTWKSQKPLEKSPCAD